MNVHQHIEETLLTADDIQRRVRELAADITRDYQAKDLFLVAVLRGAIIFLADLARNIELPITVDFMVVEKVADMQVKIIKDLESSITGKDLLLVEDVIDEGRTLQALMDLLRLREPASIKVVTIFEKPQKRAAAVRPDYVGFPIPDRFVVGYGLDYRQRFRNLPYLGVLKKEVYHDNGEGWGPAIAK